MRTNTLRKWCIQIALAMAATVGPQAGAHDQLGANLNFIGDFRRNHEFNDVVKQSRMFLRIGQFDDQQAANRAPIGADGWPTGDFRLFAMAAQNNTQGLAGTYKIIFNGQATPSVGGGGAGSVSNVAYDAATNTTRADLNFPAGGENLLIDFSGVAANNSVKNLRVLRPGVDTSNGPLLTTTWANHARRFSLVRYLDWTRTNGNRAITWADRTTPEKLKTEAYIANWETVIDAANAIGKDAWINVPVQANDEYVTNLARLFRDRLNAGLNVYVEYGNELWNFNLRDNDLDTINGGAFNGATVNRSLAIAEANANVNSPLRFGGTTDQNTWAFRRVALRLKQISDIFRAEWGDAAINTRVRPVLAGQMANSFIVTEGLRVIDEGLNIRPNTVFYALSGAPYIFGSATPDGNADEAANLTLDQLLTGMTAGVSGAPAETAYQYTTHAALGAWYGLKVVAYEAGFDNFGSNNISVKRAANLDTRIRTICRDYINQWHSFGFEHMLWFNAGADSYNTQFGMWPLVEDMTVQATPKNQCMDDIIAAPLPTVTAGNSVNAAIAGGAFRGSSNASGNVTGAASPFGFPGFVEYLVRADTAGTYSLTFRGTAPAGEGVRVKLNNATVNNNVTLPASLGNSAALNVTLRKGLNALRLERIGGSWAIQDFTFTLTGDATPDAFSFAPQTNVPTGVPITSGTATITGITVPTPISITGGSYSIGCNGVFTTAAGTITNSQTVCVRHTSAASGNTSTSTTLAIGGVTGVFTSTTLSTAPTFVLSVTIAGGGGIITSSPSGINCGATCSANFAQGTVVSLSVVPAPDNTFAGWSGACTGTAPCSVTMSQNRALTATFVNSCPQANPAGDCDSDGIPNNIETAEGRNPLLKDNDVFGVARLFVMQQFRDFLKREGDVGGIAFWTTEISANRQTRGSMAETFLGSPEYANTVAPMTRLYFSSFVRIPDFGGLAFWTSQFSSGARSLENIAEEFTRAPEFIALYGQLNNRDFVGRIYQNVLGRGTATDPTGAAFWQGELDSGRRTRGQVLLAFSESAEYRSVRNNDNLVVSLYNAMLQRAPSQAEFNADVAALTARTATAQSLIQRVIGSAEYRARFLP